MKKPIVIAMVLTFALTGCGYDDTEINEIGLIYSGGVTEEKAFIGLLEPGATWESVGYGSSVYKYPTDQRSWVSGQDAPQVQVVSSDEVRLNVPYQLYFKLNTDEEILVDFHEDIGVKVAAYTDEGWVEMLNTYFAPQVDRAMDEAALNYGWRELRSSNEARAGFQRDVVSSLKRKITEVVGGDYFCGPNYGGAGTPCGDFTFTVGKPEPVDPGLVAAIEAEQTNQANVDAQRAENLRIEEELESKRSEIELYGPEVYACLRMIEAAIETGTRPQLCFFGGAEQPTELELERIPLEQ